ncbi:MAG: gamma-glutamylcyclotransferase family protein [Saprospiraceae bacterium]|nr:gamma-glutamylcyclotransferase [Lewinella sp.]
MERHLFVYGTLMQHTDSVMARFLHARAVSRGSAFLPGRLYDLGSYPGAVYDPEEQSMITGQVYKIQSPEEVFPTLDRYEGVIATPEIPAEYTRTLVPAQHKGQLLSCWIYLYILDTDHLPLIESGNYLEYFNQRDTHRKFIRTGR